MTRLSEGAVFAYLTDVQRYLEELQPVLESIASDADSIVTLPPVPNIYAKARQYPLPEPEDL